MGKVGIVESAENGLVFCGRVSCVGSGGGGNEGYEEGWKDEGLKAGKEGCMDG